VDQASRVATVRDVAVMLTNSKVSATPSSNGFTFTRGASVARVRMEPKRM
jgi:hypothetical protein